MKASSELVGYGNEQCIKSVCEPLGEISLFGHNQNYKTCDIEKVVEYPPDENPCEHCDSFKVNEQLQAENKRLKKAICALTQTLAKKEPCPTCGGSGKVPEKSCKLCYYRSNDQCSRLPHSCKKGNEFFLLNPDLKQTYKPCPACAEDKK